MFNELLKKYSLSEQLGDNIKSALDLMYDTYKKGGKILVCGNGGSCADCEHIVGELMKGFLSKRELGEEEVARFEGICENPAEFAKKLQGAIPAISLPSQTAILSAFINDVEPDMAYAQLTYGYGRENDLLIGLSTSGNSANVVNAAKAAKAVGMKTFAMTGEKESMLSEICDVCIRVPETETYKVQELHLPIYHYLCAELERLIF